MSPLFISYIKKQYRCKDCVAHARKGYRCCDKHLTYARERFRGWAAERRAAGLCVRCNRKGLRAAGLRNKLGRRIASKGARLLRCLGHTIENRKKCAHWVAAHPEHYVAQRVREKALLDSGLCRCAAHNRLVGGFRRCDDCRKKSWS